ncbi:MULTISPECIES: hypothetical protein [Caldilinea]|jgi:hypothetical protein|uniref:hypothetical protein n=1 Tax=Caldilinea TaxID=233191 RepID=UPI0003083289|nr:MULTISPECIES: hypothetical protein [Caldilinea]MBO9394381.1 hypothetical protein [Caldilinea sp.]GIV75112.1 MAG: hypothetical protein KatS3mg049_3668 [Caldilinea sp.]
MSTSPSPAPEHWNLFLRNASTAQEDADGAQPKAWALPIETDIYILPDGRVVIADLPAELLEATSRLGQTEPCEIGNHEPTDSAA